MQQKDFQVCNVFLFQPNRKTKKTTSLHNRARRYRRKVNQLITYCTCTVKTLIGMEETECLQYTKGFPLNNYDCSCSLKISNMPKKKPSHNLVFLLVKWPYVVFVTTTVCVNNCFCVILYCFNWKDFCTQQSSILHSACLC